MDLLIAILLFLTGKEVENLEKHLKTAIPILNNLTKSDNWMVRQLSSSAIKEIALTYLLEDEISSLLEKERDVQSAHYLRWIDSKFKNWTPSCGYWPSLEHFPKKVESEEGEDNFEERIKIYTSRADNTELSGDFRFYRYLFYRRSAEDFVRHLQQEGYSLKQISPLVDAAVKRERNNFQDRYGREHGDRLLDARLENPR